jgi:thiaminase (transcriptional activator TenA)
MLFEEISSAVTDLMDKIHNLPFNKELAAGTLPQKKFIFYLMQDALYLNDFAKALALTAGKLPHGHQIELFMQFAMDTLKAERELHFTILKRFTDADYLKLEQSPFCFMYTNYLLRMANIAAVEEAVASLLPCFWVYQQVGQKALLKISPRHPYQEWFDLYSSPEFNVSVDLAISLLNELGNLASSHLKKKMIAAFRRSTQLELQFWKGSYHQETWD